MGHFGNPILEGVGAGAAVCIDFLPTLRGRPIDFLHALAIASLNLMLKGVEDALFESFAAGEIPVIKTGTPANLILFSVLLLEETQLVGTGVRLAKLHKPRPRWLGRDFL